MAVQNSIPLDNVKVSGLTEQSLNLPQIEDLFYRQKKFSISLRASTSQQRIAKLKKLLLTVENHQDEIYQAAALDFSKPSAEVDLSELFPIISEIKHTISHLKSWMKDKGVLPTLASLGTSSRIHYEPKGLVLVISPWNYPFSLTFAPLISAIAAGNAAIVKPSEFTPNCSNVIAKIIAQAFDESEVSLVLGDGRVSSFLTQLPFDHIFFTGSPQIGKQVMAAAAKNLTSVTLELGGKSPTIVDSSANIKKAARNIIWGRFSNNGQTCIAPEYVLVDNAIKAEFVEALKHQLETLYGLEKLRKTNPDYCRIVNQRHFSRIQDIYKDAINLGAQVIVGGEFCQEERYISPTILTDVSADSRLAEEEIFGPLLEVRGFDKLEEAVASINEKEKPLALYIYSTEQKNIDYVLNNTSAGDTCINHNLIHFLQLNLPFGGANNSGIGKSHGIYGFKAFSHQRSILTDKFSIVHWLFPPYTPSVKRLIQMIVKYLS